MKQKLLLLAVTLIVSFTFTEIAFTILVDEDLDGNLSINHIQLKPYKLPIKETERKIEKLIKNRVPDTLLQNYNTDVFIRKFFNVRLVPNAQLGWLPSHIYKSSNGLYIYNKDGIRSDNILINYSQKKNLRIAIFGDSYAHGDEVKYQNTIGNYLESLLLQNNIQAEVLNFAVSGYGIDQAFLRWEMVKEEFNPDIVLLGVQFENVKRNINLLRPFYYFKTEIPYSKPRYVIGGNRLQLMKNLIPDVTQTVGIIENFDKWDFSHFEGFYDKENYELNPFYLSKTISFVSSAISQISKEFNYYNSNSESYQITYKIIKEFGESVKNENGIFIPVHFPVQNDFNLIIQVFLDIFYNQKFIYDNLFSTLKLSHNFIEPYNELNNWGKNNGHNTLFMKRHYSPTANKIIADKIFEYLQNEHPKIINNTHRLN